MKVIEILKNSADLLGLGNESILLSTEDESKETALLENEEIASLFNLFKFSVRELCTNYVPVCASEEIVTQNLTFPLGNLNNFIRTNKVLKGDELANYKILNRNIVVEVDGVYTIEYFTYPEIASLFEEVDFLSTFSPDALVYGLCAYYSLAHGLFAEFESFHECYIERAQSLKELKSFTMPQRRWQWKQKNV